MRDYAIVARAARFGCMWGRTKQARPPFRPRSSKNSGRLLLRGVSYVPRIYRLGIALRQAVTTGQMQQAVAICREIRSLLSDAPGHTVVASCEALCGDPYRGYPEAEQLATLLASELGPLRPRIVLCFRRQDEFFESCYQQRIKEGGIETVQEFFDSIPPRAFDCVRLATAWIHPFGREAVRILCYDALFRQRWPLAQLFGDGRSHRQWQIPLPRANPGLSLQGLEALRLCNTVVADKAQRTALRKFFEACFARKPGEKASLLTQEQRDNFIAAYRHSNTILMEWAIEVADADRKRWLDPQIGGGPETELSSTSDQESSRDQAVAELRR
jgi:hypothetical protein